jgi:hypothetical protein
MAEEITLDLLGQLMQRTYERVARIEERVTRMEATLDAVRDDVTVLTGAWMRDEGEKLAVATLLAKVRRAEQRLDAIEARLPAHADD